MSETDDAQTPALANNPQGAPALRDVGGSQSDDWNSILGEQSLQSLWPQADPASRDSQFKGTVAALVGIGPKDELEAMIAAQLLAAHNATMECYRRAVVTDHFDGRREYLSQASKLSRSFATLLEALNKHRGKAQQRVSVEHVHVHAGGQAVVGVIEAQGGGHRAKAGEQPHGK